MNLSAVAERLWGNKGKFIYLFIAACILLFTFLSGRDLWTQEHRWAEIVYGMFYRNDFLHPWIGDIQYYDKPLLSYWLIASITKMGGELTAWSLRLPSALAGLIAIYAIYRLGVKVKDQGLGLLAGWLLLTTYYFVFWSRTSSADMLNLAGSVFAVSWYFEYRERPSFLGYVVFFLILAITSLCKGLIGTVIPLIAVVVDIAIQKSWRRHLTLTLLIATIPAVLLYLLPFFASRYFSVGGYNQNGLYMVYKENIVRYFQPFDHQDGIYTYFIYLPIYLLPWSIFFIPAVFQVSKTWGRMGANSKWLALTLLSLFLFFTLSGSRRSYYVLPMVPFAILFTADWLLMMGNQKQWSKWIGSLILFSFLFLFISIDLMTSWYYLHYGLRPFAYQVRRTAEQVQPWHQWKVIFLDAESKLNFYLNVPPQIKNYEVPGKRSQQTTTSLVHLFPVIQQKPADTIFITRKCYGTILKDYFVGYKMITEQQNQLTSMISQNDCNASLAFIPENSGHPPTG